MTINTAAMEYNFILMFPKEEENLECIKRVVEACAEIQQEMDKYLNLSIEFWHQQHMRRRVCMQMCSTGRRRKHVVNVYIWEKM